MTPKALEFIRQYLLDLNATAAATRAGYSERSAKYTARKLLEQPEVRAAIDQAMKERGDRTRVTADRVLLEVERMAMLDPADLVKVRRISDIAKLPEGIRRAITGWKYNAKGQLEIKLAKEKALEMLGRHHALFTDKLQVEVIDRAAALKRARERAKKRGDQA